MEGFVWADLFIRSAILLLGAQTLARLHNRTTAAARHRLLLFGFAFLAVLPLSSALAPSIHFPVWPWHAAHGKVSIQAAILLPAQIRETRSSWRVEEWLFVSWLSGAIAILAFAIAGRLALGRLLRRATPLTDNSWTGLLCELSSRFGLERTPAMLTLDGLATPLTFGTRRATILLPVECIEWPDLRKRVVLLHELAHIRRRDVAAQWFATLIAAIWWFQPLAWITRRMLRRESEQACDAEAIVAGARPCDYAAELIEIARNATRGSPWSRAAIAMARPRDLEGRLVRILNPSRPVPRRRGSVAAIAALAVFALTASAVTLSSKQRIPHLGGLPMKRTLISGLVTSIGLSAATITGSVFDPSGAAIPDAKVFLYEPDTSVKQESVSASNGKFTFDNLPAGQYILRIDKPGFTALLQEFTLQPNSSIERGFSLQVGSIQQEINVKAKGQAADVPPSTEPKPIRVGGKVMESSLLTKVNPVYPKAAKDAGIQGTVRLQAVVYKNGTPGEITVLSSPSDDLSQASLEAVRQWRYSSTLLNGEPVEVVTEIFVSFTLLP